jgi:hypothetical protein
MSSSGIDITQTIILFKGESSRVFPHREEFKRLLGVTKFKCDQRHGPMSSLANVLLGAITADANLYSITEWLDVKELDCSHLISIQENVKRNKFFDLLFQENIVGSFTTNNADLMKLELLFFKYIDSLWIRRSPLQWKKMALSNRETIIDHNLCDASIIDFNMQFFNSISETYGLVAFNQCKAEVSKWIMNHRWKYIE